MLSLAPGTLVAGKYRLERHLARGGMGSIWVARDERLRRAVAVKFMGADLTSPEARARFEREAQAAAQIATPHVVQVHDHGVDDDTPFIVMELLEGEDLAQRLEREHRLSLADAALVATHVGRALRRARVAGIVHRDLKPQNVFLARGDDGLVAKILDFGVAKADLDEHDTTRTGDVIGSPKYMSPEQARGLRGVDHRSDLWSLGVILFRVVTGRPPFDGTSATDIIVKICSEPVPPATLFAPDLPPAADAFFQRALARDPAQRFQTADEFVDAFVGLARAERKQASNGLAAQPAAGALRSHVAIEGFGPPEPESAGGLGGAAPHRESSGWAESRRWPIAVATKGSVAAGTLVWAHRGALRVTVVLSTGHGLVAGLPPLLSPDPVTLEDRHYGDTPTRAVRLPADVAPRVPRAEIVHAGAVIAPAGVTLVRLAVTRGARTIVDKRALASVQNDSTGLGALERRAPERIALLRGAPEPVPRGDGLLVLPDDHDFAFHQRARRDQQLDRLGGGDAVVLSNLHPEVAELVVGLPTLAPIARGILGDEAAPLALECKRMIVDTDRRRFTLLWFAELELPSLDAVPHLRVEVRAPSLDAREMLPRVARMPHSARNPSPPAPPRPTPSAPITAAGTLVMQPPASGRQGALAGTVLAGDAHDDGAKGDGPGSSRR